MSNKMVDVNKIPIIYTHSKVSVYTNMECLSWSEPLVDDPNSKAVTEGIDTGKGKQQEDLH